MGERITIRDAEAHIFGLCLLNDWSARDIQAWEYQPLGPFLSKNFASTISPWIVTLEALAPYRVEWIRPQGDPQPLSYLDSAQTRERGALDIQIEVWLETLKMREAGEPAVRLSGTSFKHAYWTIGQMVVHHSVNGCRLRPGDLFGSGTESGPTPEEAGSLLELSVGGKQPLSTKRTSPDVAYDADPATGVAVYDSTNGGWLTVGGTSAGAPQWAALVAIANQGRAQAGSARIGFGECRGTVLRALAS